MCKLSFDGTARHAPCSSGASQSSSGRRRRAPASGARARSATSGATSPTSPSSVRVIPTSITAAPVLHHLGRARARDADRGDEHVRARGLGGEVARARVADRHGRVPVQEEQRRRACRRCRCGRSRPRPRPCSSTPYSSSSSSTPSGVPGTCAGVPASSRPGVQRDGSRRRPSAGRRRGSRALRRSPSGSGSWTRMPSIGVVGVQLGDEREQLLLARRRGQPQVARLDPDLERRLVLAAGCRPPRRDRRRRAPSPGRSGARTRPPRARPPRGSAPRAPSRP